MARFEFEGATEVEAGWGLGSDGPRANRGPGSQAPGVAASRRENKLQGLAIADPEGSDPDHANLPRPAPTGGASVRAAPRSWSLDEAASILSGAVFAAPATRRSDAPGGAPGHDPEVPLDDLPLHAAAPALIDRGPASIIFAGRHGPANRSADDGGATPPSLDRVLGAGSPRAESSGDAGEAITKDGRHAARPISGEPGSDRASAHDGLTPVDGTPVLSAELLSSRSAPSASIADAPELPSLAGAP